MQENYALLLSEESRREIDVWIAKYPSAQIRSALLPALHIAQDQNKGFLTDDLLQAVADYLGLPKVYAYEVATFYSMYDLNPVGRHKIHVCNSVSCMLNGSDGLLCLLKKKLGIDINETTPDGKITLKEAECLAACGGAPAMMVDKTYHENVTAEKLDKILSDLE